MRRFFVPALGSELTLAHDWHFRLHHESRNESLFDYFGIEIKSGRPVPPAEKVVLSKGTRLIIDRIFIRKGAEDFDSITFRIKGEFIPAKTIPRTVINLSTRTELTYESKVPKKQVRFWVKLTDANNLVFDDEEDESA